MNQTFWTVVLALWQRINHIAGLLAGFVVSQISNPDFMDMFTPREQQFIRWGAAFAVYAGVSLVHKPGTADVTPQGRG